MIDWRSYQAWVEVAIAAAVMSGLAFSLFLLIAVS
jgi:hypothetical protein